MDSEDPLFIMYTSGTTGDPAGIIHSQAGYLLYAAMTHKVAIVFLNFTCNFQSLCITTLYNNIHIILHSMCLTTRKERCLRVSLSSVGSLATRMLCMALSAMVPQLCCLREQLRILMLVSKQFVFLMRITQSFANSLSCEDV